MEGSSRGEYMVRPLKHRLSKVGVSATLGPVGTQVSKAAGICPGRRVSLNCNSFLGEEMLASPLRVRLRKDALHV